MQQAGNPVVRVFFAGKRGGECLAAGGLTEVAVFEFEGEGVGLQVAALYVGKGFAVLREQRLIECGVVSRETRRRSAPVWMPSACICAAVALPIP